MEGAQELQRPEEMDLAYLGGLIQAKVDALGHREEERGELAANLAFLYEFAVVLIRDVNKLVEAPTDDLGPLASSVTSIETSIEHFRRTFLRSAKAPLSNFATYLYALLEEAEG